jgi:endoglucanase
MTDNIVYREGERDPVFHQLLAKDDNWVFTEQNPRRELQVAYALAAASRVLKGYNDDLAGKCLAIAETLYDKNESQEIMDKVQPAAELFFATSKLKYSTVLEKNADTIAQNVFRHAEILGRVTKKLNNQKFSRTMEIAVDKAIHRIMEREKENPYGVPYRPSIWGAGWDIQAQGVKRLMLHLGFPKIVPRDAAFQALNFVLGCHPGDNTSSFVSGVGVRSTTVAYGFNRDDWTYIPGGVVSGTAIIRPDLPELKVWPYFWQQTEYVMGGGTIDFMILAIAADRLFNEPAYE